MSLPSADPLFKELKFLKFDDIFKMSIAKFLTLCEESPVIFSDWFTYNHLVHSHATKSSVIVSQDNYFDVGTGHDTYTLFIRQANLTNYGRKMIHISGPLVWNGIPYAIQDSTSISAFKIYLKSFFFDKYYSE